MRSGGRGVPLPCRDLSERRGATHHATKDSHSARAGLGCGLVASVGISQMLQRNQDPGPTGETAPVWVAKTEIKPADPLNMQNLALEQWPKEKIPPGALSKMDEITDMRARVTLYQGEPIIQKKLLSKDEVSLSYTVPKGFRLITVQGDPSNSHGGILQPGDRVDVLIFVQKGNGGSQETGTKTILQDVKVFAVNDQVRSDKDKAVESITAKTVTLLVTPPQAEKLALANEIGKIRLVMRSPDDRSVVQEGGMRLDALFGPTDKPDRAAEEPSRPAPTPPAPLTTLLNQLAAPPAPITAPPADETFEMQIIKGTEISLADFKHKFDDPNHWSSGSAGSDGSSDSKPEPAAPADAGKKSAPNSSDGSAKSPAAKPQDGSPKTNGKQDNPATHS